tara:strand:- start:918 stop:1592 length:675 start_codon:yes stop_codon:yes gene_type:complete
MSWITESAGKARRLDNYYSFNGIELYVMNPLPDNINLEDVLSIISSRVPIHLQRGVDIIYVGQFKHLIDREINAVFQDGAIYVTNDQDDIQDIIDDIVHEIAHSVEKEHPDLIFEDGRLFKEFLGKRRRLYSILETEGFEVDPIFRSRVEYNSEIDDFLYKEVGYPLLNNLVMGLFPSAYASTSLREYFAIGFEEFFIGDRTYLKKICPILYSKIESLAALGEI